MTWKEIKHNENENHDPGKRWRFSMIGGVMKQNLNGKASLSSTFIFGGHRAWNNAGLYNINNATGGYLDDLWEYTIEEHKNKDDNDVLNANNTKHNDIILTGTWNKMIKKETCVTKPGITWSSRNDLTCKIIWPRARASHSAVYDPNRNVIWVFGGYNTYYPYHSYASSRGIRSSLQGKVIETPYPSYPHFLDDLWIYNITSGYWKQIVPSKFAIFFSQVLIHSLSKEQNVIILCSVYFKPIKKNGPYNDGI